MKVILTILLFYSLNCLAQGAPDAQFGVKSIKDVNYDFKGVLMVINLKVEDRPAQDHTVVYWFSDHRNKPFLTSSSDMKGVIHLNIKNFKYIKYIYIGGPGDITTKIDLTRFKGKDVVLEMEVKPDLEPLY